MPRRKLTAKEKSFNKIIRRYYKKTDYRMYTKNKKDDGTYESEAISKRGFRHRVQAAMKAYDLSPLQAAKKVLNTESFTTAAERSRTNLLNSMRKEFNADYKYLVKLNRQISRDAKGHFTSLKNNLQWDKDLGTYTLRGYRKEGNKITPVKYMIVTTESPKRVFVEEIID